MPLIAWGARRVRTTVPALLVVVAAGTACTATHAAPPANRIQGPSSAPATVVGAAGRTVTCPQGSVPYVNITGATFDPPLTGGTSFAPGDYRIVLTGTIANETTAPVTVTAVHPKVGGVAWGDVTVQAPTSLAAESSGPLRLEGTFHSVSVTKADVSAPMDWTWTAAELQPCGERGLIDDD